MKFLFEDKYMAGLLTSADALHSVTPHDFCKVTTYFSTTSSLSPLKINFATDSFPPVQTQMPLGLSASCI
jgi:hypothetical protein